jgi:hypothetical protein
MRNMSVFLSLLILFHCSQKKSYPVEIKWIDGVKVTINPDYPIEGRYTYGMIENLSIGVEEGEDCYLLNQPLDLKVSGAGNIYILDWGDTRIQAYDKNGRFLCTIGRKGKGPGEFELPASFDLSPDGKIFLLDSRNRRISQMDTTGNYLNGFRFEGFHHEIKIDDSGILYFQGESDPKDLVMTDEMQTIEKVMNLYRIEPMGQNRFCYGDFRGRQMITRRMGDGVFQGSSPDGPRTVWTIDNEGHLYAGYNGHYQITRYDKQGKALIKLGRKYDPVPNPHRGKGAHTDFMPPFKSHLLFDEKGNLWLELYTKENEEDKIYDIFSTDGIYLKQIRLKHSIRQFKEGMAYCIVRPKDGFPMVKRFKLEKEGKR